MSLTTILIALDVIYSQSRVFETFVEIIFDLIQRVNDRLLRKIALLMSSRIRINVS